MAWTDDELRAAIHEAAEAAEERCLSIIHTSADSAEDVATREIQNLRHFLTALGIDHQPKPELPDTPGSVIYDVDLGEGCSATVLTRDRDGYWVGIEAEYLTHLTLHSGRIVAFGGVLDLDKVRGEQGD